MLVIREIFVAKPGMASKLAKQFKEMTADMPGQKTRVMTDMVGNYNTVIMEMEIESLAAFEKEMEKYSKAPKQEKEMASHTEMYLTGKREIFRLW